MFVGTVQVKLYAPWVHSLKEKRMEVRRLVDRIKNKFNVSVCEADALDIHQTVVIGIGCVANSKNHINKVLQEIVVFIEANTEAEVIDVAYELF